MTFQAAFTLFLLAATLVVMATQRLRPDLVALLVMLLLIVAGIVTPEDAFSAFGQPVIVIVACVYVLGAALFDTGVATIISRQILRFGRRGEVPLLATLLAVTAGLSAFLDGLLVVAILLPAVLRIARETGSNRAKLLLPLATGATMGSQLTLIGTSSNLVVGDILAASGHAPLGLFTLTPYALASVFLMGLWFVTAGRRLLSKEMPSEQRQPSVEEVARSYGLEDQFYQLRVRAISKLIPSRLGEVDLPGRHGLNVLAVRPRVSGKLVPATAELVLEQDDLLYVHGRRTQVQQAASHLGLEVKRAADLEELTELEDGALRVAEVMVPFRSPLAGKSVAEARLRARYGMSVLAVRRQSETIRTGLPALVLAVGDTLLVEGPTSQLRRIGQDLSLVPVTDLGPQPGDLVTRKAGIAMGILALLVLVVVTGLLSLATASVAAVVALVLTGCVTPERAYRSIDGRVLVLIGGMLPLSLALEQTGAAQIIADGIAAFSRTTGPLAGLLLLFLVTSLITQVVANTVTAALVTPIAISLAVAQGLPVQPFAMAVAFAVAAAYVTPLTDGDNLLVREPGRYSMRDYLINGLPVLALQTIALVLMLSPQLAQ